MRLINHVENMELINYTNVEICQEEQIVLHNVNLHVSEGEFIYLLGKVGSGKSSLLKTFYGALPISQGEAQVLDYDMLSIRRRQLPYLRRRVGIVFQDYQLLNDRTVEDNLLFVLKATGWKDKRLMKNHVAEVLAQVGMETKAYKMPHQLSGGEQQRVVIARALLNSPELILADEPTGNLDPDTGAEIMELLYGISKAGISVIISTHNVLWPERYQGRKLSFRDGYIYEM
ncbi:MAG: ATP-binding cassette domain-containing protein [Paludibacteraceae bacterium]|nr:ATP-binding cassette domain-containing protein [Paludibacteraceae bacterium]